MSTRRETISVVLFGLALVLATSTVLFALVGINPKTADYGVRPWVYCGLSLLGGVTCWYASARLAISPRSVSPT